MKPPEWGRAKVAQIRDMFPDCVAQYRREKMPEQEIEERTRFGIAMYLSMGPKAIHPPGLELDKFIEENRDEIEPIVVEAMRILDVE